jgi:hypothetical protein
MRCNGIGPAGLVGDSEGLVFEDRPGRHSPCTAGWGGLTGVTARRFTRNGSCRPLPVVSAPFLARALARNHASRVRWSTLGYMEKVRPQFLSLRQLGRSRIFSARDCWQLSPVLAAVSDLSSGLLIGRGGSFFSEWLISLRSSGLRGFSTVLEIPVFREAYEFQRNGVL